MLAKLRDFIRPLTVAVLIFFLMGGGLVSGILEAVLPGMGIAFTTGVAGWFKSLPSELYTLIIAFGVSYTAAREVGKGVKRWAETKRGPSPYDDPEGSA